MNLNICVASGLANARTVMEQVKNCLLYTSGTVNGIGENRLGRILMKVRKELQEGSK